MREHRRITALAGSWNHDQRAHLPVAEVMDLRGQPAPGPSDRVVRGFGLQFHVIRQIPPRRGEETFPDWSATGVRLADGEQCVSLAFEEDGCIAFVPEGSSVAVVAWTPMTLRRPRVGLGGSHGQAHRIRGSQPESRTRTRQIEDLLAAGVRRDDLYIDRGSQRSGASRPAFDQVLDSLQDGDAVVITTLNRLGRPTIKMHGLAEELRRRGVNLRVDGQAWHRWSWKSSAKGSATA